MMKSGEIQVCFHQHTTSVRAAHRGCVTPSMMAERGFYDIKVVGIVENPRKKFIVETRITPTTIRRRLKSRVFGIA